MSDSVTNVDVEDVLSSIRRLVTDTNSDVRKADAKTADEGLENKPKTSSDALLLTSALRVPAKSDGPVEKDASVNDGESGAAEMANFRHAIDVSDDAKDEAHDWQETAADEYYEDDEPEDLSSVVDFIRHDRGETSENASADLEDMNGDADEDTFEYVEASDDDEGFEDVGEAEDDAEHEDQAADAETANDDSADWTPQFVHTPRDLNETEQHSDASSDDDTSETTDALPEWLEHGHAEISEAELIDESLEDSAPDDADDWDAAAEDESQAEDEQAPQTDANADEPEVEFASAAAASVFVAQPESEVESPAESGLADFEDDVIDEDALRDLVSEIVRQELTGELGERITRNVRKLVRREIHRALLTREFE